MTEDRYEHIVHPFPPLYDEKSRTPTYFGEASPYSSIIFMMAEPTMAPSEISAIFATYKGVKKKQKISC